MHTVIEPPSFSHPHHSILPTNSSNQLTDYQAITQLLQYVLSPPSTTPSANYIAGALHIQMHIWSSPQVSEDLALEAIDVAVAFYSDSLDYEYKSVDDLVVR